MTEHWYILQCCFPNALSKESDDMTVSQHAPSPQLGVKPAIYEMDQMLFLWETCHERL